MTVLDNTPRDQYTATASQTVFPYTFEIAAIGDIKVLQNGVLINQGAGAGEYGVSGVGVDTGGNVTLVTGATAGDVLTLYRDMALNRLTSYNNAGDFLAADVNNDFDRLWLALQQNTGNINRALVAPDSDPTNIDMTIPDKAARLDKLLKFNVTTGNPEVISAADALLTGGFNVYNFTGTGAAVAFTLGQAPGGENNTQVYIDGVYQQKDTYSVSSTTLTFSTAPPNLSTIEVMVIDAYEIGSTTAAQVSFTQSGSTHGSNVQLKLQESVSVKDFGAIGDGSTDDTVAIQAAMDSTATTLYFPKGNYILNNQVTLSATSSVFQFTGDGYLSSRIKCNASGVNILLEKANVEFAGLRFNGGVGSNPIAVKTALTTNYADCDTWFRDCWFNSDIHIGHQVVGRGSQFINCILKSDTTMEITAPSPYNHSAGPTSQVPEAGMRRYKVIGCDIDSAGTLVSIPNSTTADKYIHGLIISGNHFNGIDYLIRGQSCIDASIVNNTILTTRNGSNIEALIAVKYLRNVTITGNYFAGWNNETIAADGRWNILISATNDPFDFTDTTSLNETLVENVVISSNVLRNLELGVINSYGNIKRVTLIGNSFPEIFEFSNTGSLNLTSSRNYADVQVINNTLITDVANVTGSPTYQVNYGSAGGNGAELTYANTSDVTLVANGESQFGITAQGLAITGGHVVVENALTAEKTNSGQFAINSTNSNGASLLIQEGGVTSSGIGHFASITGLELSGDATNRHIKIQTAGNVEAGTDNAYTLGTSGRRWTEVFATNGTINTSDERSKEQVRSISDAEHLVAQSLKQSLKAFKFSDAVIKKGDGARIHIGVIAQEVKSIFEANGLDAHDYSLFCYDEWEAEYGKDGNEINPAGNSFGIRYDELLAFIISSL
jgi:hypothetical protein